LKHIIYRKISGKEGEVAFGWGYKPSQIIRICTELNLKCEILEQAEYLYHTHYKFDVLIFNKVDEELNTKKNRKTLFIGENSKSS